MIESPSLERIYLEDHRHDGRRSGEGCLVDLADGSLLAFYSTFQGGVSDESPGVIAARKSSDQGRSWSPAEVVFSPPPDALNAMCVSLLRLQDGRLGCVFSIKWSTDHCRPFWCDSTNEGKSWSTPRPITETEAFHVVNNDRLLQMRDGTLVVPYAVKRPMTEDPHAGRFPESANKACGLFYSLDGGTSWKQSPHTIVHTPELFHSPEHVLPFDTLHPHVQYLLEKRLGLFQEPGVVERLDGSLMMYMRSSYGIFRCFSQGVTAPWTDCRPIPGYNVCCGPQTIKRHPESGKLVLLYNDREDTPFGSENYGWRTPLSVAVSGDEGLSWQRVGHLEDASRNYCYYSLLFVGDQFYLTTYESAEDTDAEGRPVRRSLASWKLIRGPLTALDPSAPNTATFL